MKFISFALGAAFVAALPALSAGQVGATAQVKIAVIDIDRVAQESAPGKALFEKLKVENDKLAAERQQREQEIRDLQTKAASDVLSQDAQARLQRDIERKRTDATRWLEDAQREFQEKQQQEEAAFQATLGPIVEAVAREAGIGLIFRATPGLTFVLDPNLDLTPAVIQRLNSEPAADAAAPTGDGQGAETTPPPPPDPPQDPPQN
jgi:Skp family chaperone for outer membrane proteins